MAESPDTDAKPRIPLGQFLPPLLLLPLFAAPLDATTIIYWMTCAVASFISAFNLLARIGKPDAGGWNTALRPLLTIALYVAAVATAFAVDAAAGRHADALAQALQRTCQERGRCPDAPEGWRVEGKYARATYGHWKFTYVTNAPKNEFGLWIYMRNEDEKCIHGGSTVPLSEKLSVYCKSDPEVRSSSF